MTKAHLTLVTPSIVNRTVMPQRRPNADLRTREHLTEAEVQRLMDAARKNRRALRRDRCGDYMITGKLGHIFADGQGFLLYVSTQGSPRRWTMVKCRLAFCHLNQDGDDEGCLRLDRFPTSEEAELIREALGIRKRRHMSPETLAAARVSLEFARSLDKTPPGASAFA
jgi:hypothetical protein